MTDYLNAFYPKTTPQAESLEKQAQLELFAKLAADNGIDLNAFTPEQVSSLWDDVMKTASEEGGDSPLPPFMKKDEEPAKKESEEDDDDDDDDDDKDEEEKEAAALERAALEEHAQKVAHSMKIAEAVQMGEVMAHAYVAKVAELEAAAGKTASAAPATRKAPEAAKVASAPEGASAFDVLAARAAVSMARDGGYDAEKVAQHIHARLVLGAPESEKVAHIADPAQAVQTRALELLESVGLKVEWDQA